MADSSSSPGACDGPYGFRPVRCLSRGRERIFGAKVTSVSSLRCVYGAPQLFVVSIIWRSVELSISGSIRSRLSRGKTLLCTGKATQTCEYLDEMERFFRVLSICSRMRPFRRAPFRVQPDPHLSSPRLVKIELGTFHEECIKRTL